MTTIESDAIKIIERLPEAIQYYINDLKHGYHTYYWVWKDKDMSYEYLTKLNAYCDALEDAGLINKCEANTLRSYARMK